MRRSQKFTFVKSMFMVLLSISLLTLLWGGGALAQTGAITAKINGAPKSGASLQAAIDNTALDQIISIEVTAGDVTTADWQYLYTNKDKMLSLKTFIVEAGVTSVADISTGSNGALKNKKKDNEGNYYWEILIKGGSPLSSSVEYCEINKLKKIGKNGFSEVGELSVAVLPDLEEIEDFGFAEHGMLRTVIAPKLKKIGDYGFYNCKRLELLRLGEEPPTLVVGVNPANDQPNEFANVFGADTDIYCILQVYKNGQPIAGTDLETVKRKYFDVKDGSPNGKTWTKPIPTENDPEYPEYKKTLPDDMWFGWHFGTFSRIKVTQNGGGIISVKPLYYQVKDGKVQVTVTPEKGKALDKLTYTPDGGTPVEVDETFKMPGSPITISATFKTKQLKGEIIAADGTKYTNDNAGSLANLFYDTDDRPFEKLRDEAGKLDLLKVAKIRITGGYFAKSDWNWLKVNNANFAKLNSFTIDATTDQVDDIADDNDYDGYFFKGDHGALEELELHKLKNIGKAAFTNCTKLRKVSAPDAESVGESAFDTNNMLVEVNLPKVKYLGKASFNNCRMLKTLEFPELESLIGGQAYDPANPVTNSTFLDCRSLRSVDLGKVKYIPTETFGRCISLQEVKATAVEVVGDKAFSDSDKPCVNLRTITMPKLTEIGLSAFAGCSSLAQFTLPVKPPKVKTNSSNPSPFEKCKAQDLLLFVDATGEIITSGEALTKAVAAYKAEDDGNKTDDKWFGWNLPTSTLHQIKVDAALQNGRIVSTPSGYAPQGKTVFVSALPALGYFTKSISYKTNGGETQTIEGGKFVMPDAAVTLSAEFVQTSLEVSINGNATETGSSLKQIIDASYANNYKEVREIRVVAGEFSLNEWEWLEENVEALIQLKSFTIDEGVVVDDIPDVANLLVFEGYFSKKTITKVDIAGLHQIGKWVFQDTKEALTEVNFPDVTRIGEETFSGCAKLSKVSIPKLEEMGVGAFGNTFSLTEVSFPKLKKVPAGAFYSQDASSGQTVFYGILAKVDLPAVEEIGEDAFQSCHHLTTIDLPNLKKLGEKAFASCLVLNNIHFDNIEVIPTSAFYSCNKLQNFSFNKAKIIGDGAFGYSYIEDIKDELFPQVTEIGRNAFKENIRVHSEGQVTGLTTVSLSKVTDVKDGAFMNNGALVYANFPALETLGAQVFKNDKLLTTVVLPKVSLIGKEAFVGCTSLKTMVLGATPPTLNADTPEEKAKIFECQDCAGRSIVLVDEAGTPLTGNQLTTAINSYKTIKEKGADGKFYGWDEAKSEWYGWKIAEGVHSVAMAASVKNGELSGFPSFYKVGEEVIVSPRANANFQEVKGSLKAYKKGDENTKVDFVSDGQGGFLKKFVMPAYDVEVSVDFQPSPFEIKFAKLFDGTISCKGITDLRRVPWGTKVVLEITPDDGRELVPESLIVTHAVDKKITVEVADDYSFTMPPYNVVISAKFQKETEKKINVLATEHGKLFATPVTAVSGVKVALTVVPDEGFKLKEGSLKVYKHGDEATVVEVAADNTFVMPKYEVDVTATFVDKNTDVEDNLIAKIAVAPNPFSDYISIVNADLVRGYKLYNLYGEVMREGQHDGTPSLRINTEGLREGSYVLQLEVYKYYKPLSFRLIKKDLLGK